MDMEEQHTNCLPTKLSYKLLKEITNGFSEERKLGSGTFGVVYKGVHANGQKIAVKVLRSSDPTADEKQFENEFNNIARLKHPNIVQLLGYCNEEEERVMDHKGKKVIAYKIHKALCLEYIQNGSLGNYISDEYPGPNWHARYKIIKGICEGLLHLHEASVDPILHLDLKPANILLDENMVPKIADFGLSRLFHEQNTHVTSSIVGTCGYCPPEYMEKQLISTKFDIFSLGVIIAKIMIGRSVYSKIADKEARKIIELVCDIWSESLKGTLSPSFLQVCFHQVTTCIKIALKCLKRNRHERPTAREIVNSLNETERLKSDLGLGLRQFHCEESMLHFKSLITSWASSVNCHAIFGQCLMFCSSLTCFDGSHCLCQCIRKIFPPRKRRPIDYLSFEGEAGTESSDSLEYAAFISRPPPLFPRPAKAFSPMPRLAFIRRPTHAFLSQEFFWSSSEDDMEWDVPHNLDNDTFKIRNLSLKTLQDITGDFSDDRLLGCGGFGKVYKGVYEDGGVIAVKMLFDIPELCDDEQFQSKVEYLLSIQHENTVQLVGYCNEWRRELTEHRGRLVLSENKTRMLCFEYMQNGSLEMHISDETHGLDWSTRYKIIKGICEGLQYLHNEKLSPIYHLGLKPSNILLDENMVPKIDVGLPRSFGQNYLSGAESPQVIRAITKNAEIQRLPPEYIGFQVISDKFDIYSLGTIIMEIIAGNGVYLKLDKMPPHELINQVTGNWRKRQQVTSEGTPVKRYCRQVKKCMEIALECLKHDRHERPDIENIISILCDTEDIIRGAFWQMEGSEEEKKGKEMDEEEIEEDIPLMSLEGLFGNLGINN